MDIKGQNIGFALTGSFCTFANVKIEISNLIEKGANVIPIMSTNACTIDTRFGTAASHIKEMEELTSNKILTGIEEVEPLGPKNKLDALIIAPCTGNTLSKL